MFANRPLGTSLCKISNDNGWLEVCTGNKGIRIGGGRNCYLAFSQLPHWSSILIRIGGGRNCYLAFSQLPHWSSISCTRFFILHILVVIGLRGRFEWHEIPECVTHIFNLCHF
jgi:hypothetical protein